MALKLASNFSEVNKQLLKEQAKRLKELETELDKTPLPYTKDLSYDYYNMPLLNGTDGNSTQHDITNRLHINHREKMNTLHQIHMANKNLVHMANKNLEAQNQPLNHALHSSPHNYYQPHLTQSSTVCPAEQINYGTTQMAFLAAAAGGAPSAVFAARPAAGGGVHFAGPPWQINYNN